MIFKPTHGRPFGGRTWFINKEKFTNVHVEFYNDRISVLTLNYLNILFSVKGVFLLFSIIYV
jgi:hypothetical protein